MKELGFEYNEMMTTKLKIIKVIEEKSIGVRIFGLASGQSSKNDWSKFALPV